jgi:hypothetical protein
MTKERILALLIGALPVLVVLLLAVFISTSVNNTTPYSGNRPSPGSLVSIPATQPQPGTPQQGEAPGAGTGSGGGLNPLCLPLLGCI